MDYRIFNVRTWLFLCVRVHTPIASQHNIFDLVKLSCFLRSWRRQGSNLRTLDFESDALTEPPHYIYVHKHNKKLQFADHTCIHWWKYSHNLVWLDTVQLLIIQHLTHRCIPLLSPRENSFTRAITKCLQLMATLTVFSLLNKLLSTDLQHGT